MPARSLRVRKDVPSFLTAGCINSLHTEIPGVARVIVPRLGSPGPMVRPPVRNRRTNRHSISVYMYRFYFSVKLFLVKRFMSVCAALQTGSFMQFWSHTLNRVAVTIHLCYILQVIFTSTMDYTIMRSLTPRSGIIICSLPVRGECSTAKVIHMMSLILKSFLIGDFLTSKEV